MDKGSIQGGERGTYSALARTTMTYHGMAYGARAPGLQSAHSSYWSSNADHGPQGRERANEGAQVTTES